MLAPATNAPMIARTCSGFLIASNTIKNSAAHSAALVMPNVATLGSSAQKLLAAAQTTSATTIANSLGISAQKVSS